MFIAGVILVILGSLRFLGFPLFSHDASYCLIPKAFAMSPTPYEICEPIYIGFTTILVLVISGTFLIVKSGIVVKSTTKDSLTKG